MLSQSAACINCSVGTYGTGVGSSMPCAASPQPISFYLVPSSLTATPSGFYCQLTDTWATVCGAGGCLSGCADIAASADNNTATVYNGFSSGQGVAVSIDYCFSAPVLPQTYTMICGETIHDRGSWTARTAPAAGGPYTVVQTFSVTRGGSPHYVRFDPLVTTPALCWNMVTEAEQWQLYLYEAYWSAVFCPQGFYLFANLSGCVACPAGTYANGWGVGAVMSANCHSCSPGSYASTLGATIPCDNVCPAGQFSLVESSACMVCEAGLYSSQIGASTCQVCSRGTYSTTTGAVGSEACQACVAGSFSSALGQSSCEMCDQGTFSTSAGAMGSRTCQACVAGSFSSLQGASVCISCSASSYGTGTGMPSQSAACMNCALGTYATGVGSSMPCTNGLPQNAISCLTGQYASVSGCQPCSAGTYATDSGALTSSTCQICMAGSFSSSPGATLLTINSSKCTQEPFPAYQLQILYVSLTTELFEVMI